MAMQMRPRREALQHELERLRREKQVLLEIMTEVREGALPLKQRARELHAAGYSNAWIAEILRIPLSEARGLTQ